jgi:hypothetical protein
MLQAREVAWDVIMSILKKSITRAHALSLSVLLFISYQKTLFSWRQRYFQFRKMVDGALCNCPLALPSIVSVNTHAY